MTPRHSLLVTVAATTLVVTACGPRVPTNQEAMAALSAAVTLPLTRILPASAYCMTANPDFSFGTMGQVDFVEMFQNLSDKEPLFDATKAGVVRVELQEFRFNPAGSSPDPACDAVHAQSKASGYTGTQIRLAVVRPTLTPAGTAAGVRFDSPIEIATREVVEVKEIRSERGGAVAVHYTWRWAPTTMGQAIGYTPPAPQDATARLRKSDSGWTVEDAGVK